ncbi:MAG: hypothetical protein GX824_02675 [Clostridiales bacterium]|jgi:hypothetical protein|nr:hypothetical protein [Clostridiales bacterium]
MSTNSETAARTIDTKSADDCDSECRVGRVPSQPTIPPMPPCKPPKK